MKKNDQMVFLVFDEVITDNRIIVNENGEEVVICHRLDQNSISKEVL